MSKYIIEYLLPMLITLVAIKFFPFDWLWCLLFFWAWISFFHLINKRTKKWEEFQLQTRKRDEYEALCDLHCEAFVHNDFEALQALAKEFHAGATMDYWKDYPDLQQKIIQAVKKLAELVESGRASREPELEDFYYMGIVYERGLECEKDLDKAMDYFEKALDTKNCWSHWPQDNEALRTQIKRKLSIINSILTDMQFKGE